MDIECSSCSQSKPESEFYPRNDRPGMFLSGCRACRSAYAKARTAVRKAAMLSITPVDILSAYEFDAVAGEFFERESGAAPARNAGGYVLLKVCGTRLLGHRAAWFLFYGRWPDLELDHINHDRADNRRQNLREVTRDENARNLSCSTRNSSGVVGVSWYAARGKWVAQIGDRSGSGRQTVVLGHFEEFQDAVKARKEAEARLGYHINHGARRQQDKEVS